jgi:protein-S-isoprenylcysteine O-methyltransferase Ste14
MRLARVETAAQAAGALGASALVAMALHGLWQGLRRPKGRAVGRPYRRLPWPLFAGLSLAYGVAVVRLWRPLPVRLSAGGRAAALGAGTFLYWAGLGLTAWGRVALGDLYDVSTTAGAELYAGHRLVTSGPFRLVRHPMYLGALVGAVGGVLLYRTWTAAFLLAHAPIFWLRARREEQVLAAEFGEAWRDYARRVPAGVPLLGPVGLAGTGEPEGAPHA